MTTHVHKNDWLDDILVKATNAINNNAQDILEGKIDTDFFPLYLIFRDLKDLEAARHQAQAHKPRSGSHAIHRFLWCWRFDCR